MAEGNGMVAPTLTDIQLSKWRMRIPTNQRDATEMKITTVGIDLAKNVFQIHGVDSRKARVKARIASVDTNTNVNIFLSCILIANESHYHKYVH